VRVTGRFPHIDTGQLAVIETCSRSRPVGQAKQVAEGWAATHRTPGRKRGIDVGLALACCNRVAHALACSVRMAAYKDCKYRQGALSIVSIRSYIPECVDSAEPDRGV